MLSAIAMIRMIYDAQKALNIENGEFSRKAGISLDRWLTLRKGRGKLSFDELPRLAKVVGLSFQIVAPHHTSLMQLTEEEIAGLRKLAEHYKKNGPQQPHPLRSAVEKLTEEES